MLRQQWQREGQTTFRSLADYIAPVEIRHSSLSGVFAVSSGFGTHDLVMEFKRELDDYSAIMVESLADRFAEAFAEYLHEKARHEWEFGRRKTVEGRADRGTPVEFGPPRAILVSGPHRKRKRFGSCSRSNLASA